MLRSVVPIDLDFVERAAIVVKDAGKLVAALLYTLKNVHELRKFFKNRKKVFRPDVGKA